MVIAAGVSLSKLVEWLKAGSIEREAGLLKALAQAPIPKKLPQEGTGLAADSLRSACSIFSAAERPSAKAQSIGMHSH